MDSREHTTPQNCQAAVEQRGSHAEEGKMTQDDPLDVYLKQPWFNERTVCEWLSVSRHTMYRWRKRGLPFIGRGRLRRYNLVEVLGWVDKYDTKLR